MSNNLKTIFLSEEEKHTLKELLKLNQSKPTINITSTIYLLLEELETIEKVNYILFILDNLKLIQKRILREFNKYLQDAIIINESKKYKHLLSPRELISASTRLRDLRLTASRVSLTLNKYKEFHSEV